MDFVLNLAKSHLPEMKKFLKKEDPKSLKYEIRKDRYLFMWMVFSNDIEFAEKIRNKFQELFPTRKAS